MCPIKFQMYTLLSTTYMALSIFRYTLPNVAIRILGISQAPDYPKTIIQTKGQALKHSWQKKSALLSAFDRMKRGFGPSPSRCLLRYCFAREDLFLQQGVISGYFQGLAACKKQKSKHHRMQGILRYLGKSFGPFLYLLAGLPVRII